MAETWLVLCLFLSVSASSSVSLTGLQGRLESPGYPQGYPNEVSQSWEIVVPGGYGIELRFSHIDIEPSSDCAYDSLEVFSEEENYPRMCGQSNQGPRRFPFPLEYRTSDNRMTVKFTSDFSNDLRYTGFSAHYTVIDIDECQEGSPCSHHCNNYIGGYYCGCRPNYHLLDDRTRCGVNCSSDTFTRFKGSFSSPNYPNPYAENSQCHYRIQIEKGFEVILQFAEEFEVEELPETGCTADVLKITSGGKVYGPFCGNRAPKIPQLLENTVDVTFSTDGRGEKRGWKINYHSTAKQCPVNILDRGVISPKKSEYDYRDTVTAECQTGYELLDLVQKSHPPSLLFACQIDGSWNSSSIACVRLDCGLPRRLRNGVANFSSTLYESRNIYSCHEPYYTLEGAAEFECSSDAEWVDVVSKSPTLPKCEAVCGNCDALYGLGRIFGGSIAERGLLPWQVRVKVEGAAGGGALVGEGWVLTAAHVVAGKGLPQVYGGMVNLLDRAAGELAVRSVFVHPGYQGQRDGTPDFDNDIALIKLQRRPKMGPTLASVCLPGPGQSSPPPERTVGVIAGWGRTEDRQLSLLLHYARIPLVNMGLCRRAEYGQKRPAFTDNMLCAGEPGTDSCQGDSGGPLVFLGAGDRCVVGGVVSFGPPACGSYGVYTQVGKYGDWLAKVMEEEGEWEGEEDDG